MQNLQEDGSRVRRKADFSVPSLLLNLRGIRECRGLIPLSTLAVQEFLSVVADSYHVDSCESFPFIWLSLS